MRQGIRAPTEIREGVGMSTLEFNIDGGPAALSVRRFSIREALSDILSVSVVACIPDADLDLDAILLQTGLLLDQRWMGVRPRGGQPRLYGRLRVD